MNYSNTAERYRLTREIAEEGIILLKNKNNLLPIGKEKVAVFGRTQVDTIKCGTGSAFCQSEYEINVLQGIRNAGIAVDEVLAEKYIAWTQSKENAIPSYGVWGSGAHVNPEMPVTRDEVRDAALRGCEKAIVVFGRTAGENDDVVVMEGDFLLSPEEKLLLESVCHDFSRVIVVINSGNLLDLSFTEREEIGAVVLLNLPGMEGGNALGNILSGRVSPSGKLTDTIARHYGDYPSSKLFGAKAGIVQNYDEDIFVGYRYFETFPYAKSRVLYPFGHGLSYTTFAINCTHFECDKSVNGNIRAVISVKNTGKCAGKEVVMLYTASPKSALGTPSVELRAFEKTRLLAPGEEAYLTLSVPIAEMASFDDTGILGTPDAWVMAEGEYTIYMGNRIDSLTRIGAFENAETTVIKTCVHMDTELSERLKADGSYEKLDCIPPDPSLGTPIPAIGKCSISADAYFACSGDYDALEAGDTVTYRLSISAAGPYRVCFEAEKHTDLEITLNGLPLADAADYYKGAEIVLPIGSAELAFKVKSDGKFGLRAITLEKNNEPISIAAEGVSYIEGGKYTECALWVVNKVFKDTEGLKSGRGLIRMHTPGRYAMYRLNVERAGFYDIRLRYSNGHPAMDLRDTFSFLVSNVKQEIEKVTLEHTTDDAPVFRTSAPIRLALPNGEAYVKIVSVTTTSPFLAYLELTPSTREDVSVEKRDTEQTEKDTNISDIHDYSRKVLPVERAEYDFRDVIEGKRTMGDFVDHLTDEELALLSCGNSDANGKIGALAHLGIPETSWADGPVGLRLDTTTTVYPSGTMVASTWNRSLAKELGRAIGCEANQCTVDVWLAPAINIHRNPCCGRNFEYDSEDPFVAGEIASAIVNGVQEYNVAATVKHFAANNTEYQRMRSNSRVSARALREIYMKAFEIVIKKSNPYSIMTSYNHINGIKVCEDPVICRGVIREDFGYRGVLMSDFSNDSIHIKELAAGHDLKMHFGDPKGVTAALADGTLDRESVKASVTRNLEMIAKTSVKNGAV